MTFTLADVVAPGAKVTARHLASLAEACNTRELSGLGDFSWRSLAYLHAGLFRQVRNQSESGLMPPEAEFWHVYQMLPPKVAGWPVAGPGDPEGANLANPMMAFVHGSEALQLASERQRLAEIPVGFADLEPMTPRRLWLLAKYQRGAFDPRNGAVQCPVFNVARDYAYVRHSLKSRHGNAYGGFLPTPAEVEGVTCEDPGGGVPIPRNLAIRFTRLADQFVREYPGTCPEEPTHVAFISYTPWAYVVFLNNGQVDYLSKAEWTEGLYSANATLSKTSAEALGRVLAKFASDFRGSDSQRAEPGYWNDDAFDLNRFLNVQYALAPQVGEYAGEGGVVPIYPGFRALSGGTDNDRFFAPGHALECSAGGDSLTMPPGTVGNAVLVWVTRLARPCRVQVLNGTTVVVDRVVTPDDTGAAEFIVTLNEQAQRFDPMRVVLPEGATFDMGDPGELRVETTCLMAYKPEVHDWYLVTRLAAYNGAYDKVDGAGTDEESAQEIGTHLFESSCPLPVKETSGFAPAGIEPPSNQNAVFDAARRLSHCLRLVPEANLVGYEVSEGKSVLYFQRYAFGPGTSIDLLAGIAPTPENVTTIKWGRRYRVVSGAVLYAGTHRAEGTEFTGERGQTSFTGPGLVREADGIRRVAEPQDFTNRWCLSLTLKPYHPSGTSSWKLDDFAKVNTPLFDRCHFDSPEIDADRPTREHFAFGQRPTYIPEAPPGYRYVPTPGAGNGMSANKRECSEGDTECEDQRANFYRSCRLYEPPLEVESVTEELLDGGGDMLDESELEVDYTGLHAVFTFTAPRPGFLRIVDEPYDMEADIDADPMIASADWPTSPVRAGDVVTVRLLNGATLAGSRAADFVQFSADPQAMETGVVKVTLTGRLHHNVAGGYGVGRNPAGWNSAAIRAEPYRTLENGILEWLLARTRGVNASRKTGDNALNSGIQSDPDNPYGSAFPTFLLSQLVPSPYLDDNEEQDEWDSPLFHDQMRLVELKLRAWCEGAVDGTTTDALACEWGTTTLFDFTYASLMMQATGNRWIPLEPRREGNAQGFGPQPNTELQTGVFNPLAQAVNQLNTFRVMLPATLQSRTTTRTYEHDVTNQVLNAAGQKAVDHGFSAGASDFAIYLNTGGRLGTPTTVTTDIWMDTTTTGVATGVALWTDGTTALLTTTTQTVEFRWSLNANAELALPPALAAIFDLNPAVRLETQELRTQYERKVVSGESSGTSCNGFGGADSVWSLGPGSGQAVEWQGDVVTEDPVCRGLLPGLESGGVTAADVWYAEDVLGPPRPDCGGANQKVTNITALTSTPAVTVPTAPYGGRT